MSLKQLPLVRGTIWPDRSHCIRGRASMDAPWIVMTLPWQRGDWAQTRIEQILNEIAIHAKATLLA